MLRSAALASAVLVSQAIFVLVLAFGAPCPERCGDDGADGRCLPLCMACACSPHPAPAPTVAVVSAPGTAAQALLAELVLAPGTPDPGDIFHVPKRLLA